MKSLTLKPGKERSILNRHPWIFSGAIKKTNIPLKPGDVVAINSHEGEPIAMGHWCGEEGLVCRIFSFEVCEPNEELWWTRLCKAKRLRQMMSLPSEQTNGYRLIHGEGDGFSGLVVDIFGVHASVSLVNPGFWPVIPTIKKFLEQECNVSDMLVTDNSASTNKTFAPLTADFVENGLWFNADIGGGQKTGHFLDQRENRLVVQTHARGRTVLDAFCYSGGFSVYALKGEAKDVLSVDISNNALDLVQRNVSRNFSQERNFVHKTHQADCFDYLRTIPRGYFDLIILDPPAFAKSSQAVMRASRGYKDINLLGLKAIRSAGLIFTFSCSQHVDIDLFKKIIFAAAKDSQRDVRIIKELSQGSDHPVSIYCPQSNYLKGLVLYVD